MTVTLTDNLTTAHQHLERAASLDKAYARAQRGEQAEEIFEQMVDEVRGAELEVEMALTRYTENAYGYFEYIDEKVPADMRELNLRHRASQGLIVALTQLQQVLTIVSHID